MSALVISAFPACGKSYYYNTHKDSKVLDSDSSQFSWVYKEDSTKERNPEFPANYIQHIKDNLDKQDIIFVSSHEQVRGALYNAKIKFVLVYPATTMQEEWGQRILNRGSSEEFCKLIMDNWKPWTRECLNDELASQHYSLTKTHPYIDDAVIDKLKCLMRCQGYI